MSVFEAFVPELVVDQFARKIDSLCVWDSTLLAGLNDGSLLFFNEDQVNLGSSNTSTSAATPQRWQVSRVQKNFGKKTVAQLLVLPGAQPLLLSLSDDGVNLHTLPELQQRAQATRSAKATAFAWEPVKRVLAVAVKKKVITHHLASNDLVELTEYNLPEAVACLQWLGGNIIVGTRKSYYVIVPQSSQPVEVLPGQHMNIYPTVTPQHLFGTGSSNTPSMAVVPGGEELLLSKDNAGCFIKADGSMSRKSHLSWSDVPVALVCSDMYAVALLPKCIEVRSVSRINGPAVTQMMVVPAMSVLTPCPAEDGSIYIASSGEAGIRRLRPVPLERQARLLAAAGEYQGALELCTQIPDEPQPPAAAAAAAGGAGSSSSSGSSAKRALEDSLRLQFGHHLFSAGEYDEALTQFSMCSDASPLLLLRLYPSLVPDKFQPFLPTTAYGEPLPEPPSSSSSSQDKDKDDSAVKASVAIVIPYLLSHRTRLLTTLASILQQASTASSTATLSTDRGELPGTSAGGGGGVDQNLGNGEIENQRDNGIASTTVQPLQQQTQQRGRSKSPGKKHRKKGLTGSGNVVMNGESPGRGSNSSNEQQVDVQQPTDPQQQQTAPPQQQPLQEGGLEQSSDHGDGRRSQQQVRLMATIIDSAIMRAMLMQQDTGALLRLLQQQNFVDLEEGESALMSAGRYAELAALYQYCGRHEAGLEVLRKLAVDAGKLAVAPCGAAADLGGLPGVWAAVRYLVSMAPQDLSVIRHHAAWVLGVDPEAGLEAFVQMRPPLPPAVVLPILQAHAPDYCPVYLETALDMGLASPDDFHSQLLLMYLHMALEEEAQGAASAQNHARKLSLSDILVHRPQMPLKLFPDDPAQWAAAPFTHPSTTPHKIRGRKSDLPPPWGRAININKTGASSEGTSPGGSRPNSRPGTPISPRKGKGLRPSSPMNFGQGGDAAAGPAGVNGSREDDGQEGGMEMSNLAPNNKPNAIKRLRDLVYTSPHIDPEYVLAKLPPDSLLEIRALMLERLGRHQEALVLHVHGLKDLHLAEVYCDRVYAAAMIAAHQNGVKGGAFAGGAAAGGNVANRKEGGGAGSLAYGIAPPDIYYQLVEAVMQEGADDSSSKPLPLDATAWHDLALLLSRKRDRIDTLRVLDMLPADLPLTDITPLIEAALLHATELTRNLAVVKNLRRGENLIAREELVYAKQRYVTLTSDRACCICHKRIGTSVSVGYPNGTLAHYLCHKRSQGETVGVQGVAAASAGWGGLMDSKFGDW